MAKNKNTKKTSSSIQKKTVNNRDSFENEKPIWRFDRIDNDGEFAFNVHRPDFQHEEFLDKMISYSNMTWSQIRQQTHDEGKSKHHFISYDQLSKLAQNRIAALKIEDYTDSIYSFALKNKLRIIGLRGDNSEFHILWYDPDHEVCPSRKSHT